MQRLRHETHARTIQIAYTELLKMIGIESPK